MTHSFETYRGCKRVRKRIVSLSSRVPSQPQQKLHTSFEKAKMRDVTPLQRIFDAQLKSHAARGPFCPWECAAVLDLCELPSIQRVCVLCSCCLFVIAMRNILLAGNPAWWDYRTSPDAHTPPHTAALLRFRFSRQQTPVWTVNVQIGKGGVWMRNREVSARGIRETGTSRATLSAFCLHLCATHKSRIRIFAVQKGIYLVRENIKEN